MAVSRTIKPGEFFTLSGVSYLFERIEGNNITLRDLTHGLALTCSRFPFERVCSALGIKFSENVK